jgi:MoxR-like ATPase
LIVLRLSVRAATPPAPSDVSKALDKLLARHLSASERREAFTNALARLRADGLVDARRLTLTAAGLRRAQVVLRLKQPPQAKDWRELKSKYLPRVLFEADLPDNAKINPVAALLAQRLGVPIAPKATVPQVVNIALKAASGATRVTADVVAGALTTQWLFEHAAAAPVESPAAFEPPPPRPATASTLEHVVEKVRRASAGAGVRRYGPEKVFIASVWEVLAGDAEIAALGEQGFKDVLAEAHRRGLVTLSRADLVAAMDPRDVAASEIRQHNATYHFIQRGASA